MSGDEQDRSWTAVVAAVLARPSLWWVALRQAVRLVPDRWWRRRPPLPRPDAAYVRFRAVTSAGGDGDEPPGAAEVVAWLRWSRTWRAVAR